MRLRILACASSAAASGIWLAAFAADFNDYWKLGVAVCLAAASGIAGASATGGGNA